MVDNLLKKLTCFLFVTLLSTATLFAVPEPSWAQASTPTIPAAETVQAITDGEDIPADKVDQFAQAYLQVLQLLSDREPELPAAETSTEALDIQQSIESAAIAIIQNAGLTMPEYMQILGLASQDETFQDKVLGRMDESAEE